MLFSKNTRRGALAAGLLLGGGGLAAAEDKASGAADADKVSLPPAGVVLSVQPSEKGPWRMELQNSGPAPVRLLADARMLWFEEIEAPELVPPKKKTKPQGFVPGKIPVCRVPSEMRPEGELDKRWLILRPGERYEENFDPMLLCGAGRLMTGLRTGAVIYPHYGYPPVTRKAKDKDPLPPLPHILDSIAEPRAVMPARGIDSTVFVLMSAPPTEAAPAPAPTGSASAPEVPSSALEPSKEEKKDPGPPPPVDERAARFKLTSTPLVDARDVTEITTTVTMTNDGLRPALIHFRPDDIGFVVMTPDGRKVRCDRGSNRRGAVRDFFETMRPGSKRSASLRAQEVCPIGTFAQPGIYSMKATLYLNQSGDTQKLAATVVYVEAEQPTKVRVRTGKLPYQSDPPAVAK